MTSSFEQPVEYAPRASGGKGGKKRSPTHSQAKKKWGKARLRAHTIPATPMTYATVLRQFVACGRCSSWLAGYRLLYGATAVEEAITHQQDGWLILQWDKQTRDLLHRIYDVQVEADTIYFDLSCEECQRRFRYQEQGDGVPAETFLVDLKL